MQPIPNSRWPRRAAATLALVLAGTLLALSLVPIGADGRKRLPRQAKAVRVAIKNFKYRPPTLRIRRGTKVVFVNRDRASHTATRRGSFDTGNIRRGRAATVRFRRSGVYRYVCTIHPFMRGKIIVR